MMLTLDGMRERLHYIGSSHATSTPSSKRSVKKGQELPPGRGWGKNLENSSQLI